MDITTALSARLEERQKSNVSRIYSRSQIEQGIIETFELVGGVPRLALWANDPKNYGKFLELMMKIAPKEQTAEAARNVIQYRSNIPSSPLNRGAQEDETVIEDGTISGQLDD